MADNFEYVKPPSVRVWGLPLAPLTFAQTLDEIDKIIATGKPHYFITANLQWAMLSNQDARLGPINEGAAFITADGFTLVSASRWRSQRLPERVTGSDLVPMICERAASKGYRLYFLGGAPGVADEAAAKMRARYPGLQIVGIESPPFRALSPEEEKQQLERIRAAKPHLLFIAFGQPRGEFWMAQHYQSLGVPVSVQIGATFDFLAGRVRRAPRWMQKIRCEWVYRTYQEPKRMGPRYAKNALFLAKMLARDLLGQRT